MEIDVMQKAKKVTQNVEAEVKVEAKKIKKPLEKTVSYYGRLGVVCGLSSEEILEVFQDLFPNKDWEKFKSYPNWYRAEVKKRGLELSNIQKLYK